MERTVPDRYTFQEAHFYPKEDAKELEVARAVTGVVVISIDTAEPIEEASRPALALEAGVRGAYDAYASETLGIAHRLIKGQESGYATAGGPVAYAGTTYAKHMAADGPRVALARISTKAVQASLGDAEHLRTVIPLFKAPTQGAKMGSG